MIKQSLHNLLKQNTHLYQLSSQGTVQRSYLSFISSLRSKAIYNFDVGGGRNEIKKTRKNYKTCMSLAETTDVLVLCFAFIE